MIKINGATGECFYIDESVLIGIRSFESNHGSIKELILSFYGVLSVSEESYNEAKAFLEEKETKSKRKVEISESLINRLTSDLSNVTTHEEMENVLNLIDRVKQL